MTSAPRLRASPEMEARRTIDEILEDARATLHRMTPETAYEAACDGAVVDVRSEDERRRQAATVPGAVHHPLSVVAWRLDPAVSVCHCLLDRSIAEVIEFYPARDPAERELAEILSDEPEWVEKLEIVRVDFDGADVRVERA